MDTVIISAAMEDYLTAVYIIEKKKKVARVSDIGRYLNVRKASVVSAVVNLQAKGLLIHEKYGFINLTEAGRARASGILKKYGILYGFLTEQLKVDEEAAKREADGLEHILSEDTIRKLVLFIKSAEPKKSIAARKQPRKKTAKAPAVNKKAKKKKKKG